MYKKNIIEILNYSAIFGICVSIFNLILKLFNISSSYDSFLYTTIMILLLFYTIKILRNKIFLEQFSYVQSLKLGSIVSFFSSFIVIFYIYLIIQFYDYSIVDKYHDVMMLNLQNGNLDENEINNILTESSFIFSPLFISFLFGLQFFISGVFFSFFLSFFLKYKPIRK